MVHTRKVKFTCSHCGSEVKTTLEVAVDQQHFPEKFTTVFAHNDMPPVKCEHCNKFTQIEVSHVTFEYEAAPIQIS